MISINQANIKNALPQHQDKFDDSGSCSAFSMLWGWYVIRGRLDKHLQQLSHIATDRDKYNPKKGKTFSERISNLQNPLNIAKSHPSIDLLAIHHDHFGEIMRAFKLSKKKTPPNIQLEKKCYSHSVWLNYNKHWNALFYKTQTKLYILIL